MNFTKGQKFSIGIQSYAVVCEKNDFYSGLPCVVVEYKNVHNGENEKYTFSKEKLVAELG